MYNPIKPSKTAVLSLIKQTWESPYVMVYEDTYAVFKKKFNYYEVDHTDGIGTKGHYHWEKRTLRAAVLDALAMNLNDLALVRATPYKLQNHIVLPVDDNDAVVEIVAALVDECKMRKIAITGGETSIHNTSDGLDIGMTVSGFIKKRVKNKFQVGDVLIGLPSSGLHSNGITRVRELLKGEDREEFTTPTRIYIDDVLRVCEQFEIHGMMHITGGAYTKLLDLLDGVDVHIYRGTVKPQQIFLDLYDKGMTDVAMYRTFNCGIGFVLSITRAEADKIARLVKGYVIGEVVLGTGKVKIESGFSKRWVVY